ncbi:MAG: hypothetical protein MJ218_00380 [Opitutales bacterium]|nr:hypothetical protein [Opitutales bacterium]
MAIINEINPILNPQIIAAPQPDNPIVPNDIIDDYYDKFKVNGTFDQEEAKIFTRLNAIVEYKYDITSIDQLIVNSRFILPPGPHEVEDKYFIDHYCREGYNAYLFYVKWIVGVIHEIHNTIAIARDIAGKLKEMRDAGATLEELKQKVPEKFDALKWYTETAMKDYLDEFRQYLQYNNDTKQWDLMTGEVDTKHLKNYTDYHKLKELRETLVPYTDTTKGNPYWKLPIFRSLNLLSRLEFIHFYYKRIILDNDHNYLVFPADPATGYPCVPDDGEGEGSASDRDGNVELFYIGYLVDKFGALNAPATFLDVKVRALRANLELLSHYISAFNVYLDFIAHATDMVNASQNGATDEHKHRLADAAYLALIFLLSDNMYCLFEDESGKSLLVLENPDDLGKFMLLTTDTDGKRFLLGEDGTVDSNCGDGTVGLRTNQDNKPYCINANEDIVFSNSPTEYYTADVKSGNHYGRKKVNVQGTFKLPAKLTCTNVLKKSVKEWNAWCDSSKITGDVASSWISALNNKSEFINTSIQNTNTEITDAQTTINNYDSEASNIRKKAEEIYGKVIEKFPAR